MLLLSFTAEQGKGQTHQMPLSHQSSSLQVVQVAVPQFLPLCSFHAPKAPQAVHWSVHLSGHAQSLAEWMYPPVPHVCIPSWSVTI